MVEESGVFSRLLEGIISNKLGSLPATSSPDQLICHIPSRGDLCPMCFSARMDYDGMLNLTCLVCGYQAPGGGFT